MDRKRQEPTLGKPDLDEVEFRPRSYRGPSRHYTEQGSPQWLKAAIGLAIVIAIAMGLIEWNAKRQAAAMTAELLRPMTSAEKKHWDEQMRREAEDDRKAVEAAVRTVRIDQAPVIYAPRAPLKDNQRCISGRRYERIRNGWRDLPNEPC